MSIEIEPGWVLSNDALVFRFVRSSGPGGQNVNKVASKVELRFDVNACTSLSQAQRNRLRKAFPGFHTAEGVLILAGDRHRTQRLNKADVTERLCVMLRSIRRPPKPRVKTAPTQASRKRRVADKRRNAETKRQRRSRGDGD